MSNYNLGTASGVIAINYQTTGTPPNPGPAVSASATQGEAALDKLGTASIAAGGIIAGGFAVAAYSAANFQQGLSNIQAVSGATTAEMETVRKKALQLGADTSFSATDAASAIEELAKAGLTIPEIMNGAADATVALAAAGGIDLPEAATIAANAMNQFGLAAEDMPRIADLIAGAANASAIDVSQFGFSLSQVGAVAKLAGLSFDDTAVAIAELGNAGIKGSDAGTSLKTMLNSLQPSTEKASKEFERLGLLTEDGTSKFYDQAGALKPLGEIQQTLKDSLQGMTKAQQQASLEILFGSDAIRAAAILAKNGADGYSEMAGAMGKVSAADVAATKMDNLNGSIEQAKGSLETAGIIIGTMLLPALKLIVDKVTEVINWFVKLDQSTQENIAIAAAFVAGVLIMFGAILKIITGAKALRTTLAALNVVMRANPALFIVAGLIALGVALYLLYQRSETFRDIVDAAFARVKQVAAVLVDYFQTAWPYISEVMQAVADYAVDVLWPMLKTAFAGVVAASKAAVDYIITNWPKVQAAIAAVVDWIVANVWPVLVVIFDALVVAVEAVVDAMVTAWPYILAAVKGAVKGIAAAIPVIIDVVMAVVNFLTGTLLPIFVAVFKALLPVVTAAVSGIVRVLGPLALLIGTIIVGAITLLVAFIRNLLIPSFTYIYAIVAPILVALFTAAAAAFNGIKDTIVSVFTFLMPYINAAWETIKLYFTVLFDFLVPFLQLAWDQMLNIITTVLDVMKVTIDTVFNIIRDIINVVIALIHGDWSGAWTAIKQLLVDVWEAIKAYIAIAISFVKDSISNGLNAIKGIWDNLWGTFSGAVSGAFGAVLGAVQSGISGLEGWFNGIVSFIAGLPGQIASAASGMWDGVANAFRSMVNRIIGWWNNLSLGFDGFTVPIPLAPDISVPGFSIGTPDIPYLAKGGKANANSPYIVGERGPEFFVPRSSGQVINANETAQILSNMMGMLRGVKSAYSTMKAATAQIGQINSIKDTAIGVAPRQSAWATAPVETAPTVVDQRSFSFPVYYPNADKASDAVARTTRTAAAMGVFG